jgi:hypothetical protein
MLLSFRKIEFYRKKAESDEKKSELKNRVNADRGN